MTYLGTARIENGLAQLPDTFGATHRVTTYEVLDIGGDILIAAGPLDRARLERIKKLADDAIRDHRSTLEGLAR